MKHVYVIGYASEPLSLAQQPPMDYVLWFESPESAVSFIAEDMKGAKVITEPHQTKILNDGIILEYFAEVKYGTYPVEGRWYYITQLTKYP